MVEREIEHGSLSIRVVQDLRGHRRVGIKRGDGGIFELAIQIGGIGKRLLGVVSRLW